MKRSIKSSGVGGAAGQLLSTDELEHVNGGWCGTPVPGIIPVPQPEPDPEPWYQMTLADIASEHTGRMVVSRMPMKRF